MLPSLLLGISLAAACGLRVFLPALVLCIAARMEFVQPARGFDWIASPYALVVIALGAAAELAAYHVARARRMMELAATPAAMVAGTLLCAAPLQETSPVLALVVPLFAGGGIAGISQSLVSFRPLPPAMAAGCAILLAVLALFFPIPVGSLAIAFFVVRWKLVRQAVAR